MDYTQTLRNELAAIARAMALLDKPTADNINLAVFMLRDLNVTRWQELDEMAWEYYRDSYTVMSEVKDLAEFLKNSVEFYIEHPEEIPAC